MATPEGPGIVTEETVRADQAHAIIAEIRTIDEQVDAAAERFNGANYELQKLTSKLARTHEDLVRARRHLGVAQHRVAARLVELYVNGDNGSTLDVLIGATSLTAARGCKRRTRPGVEREAE